MAGRAKMERRGSPRGGATFARSVIAAGLLSLGFCVGAFVGSVFEGPRLLIRSFVERAEPVELDPAEGRPGPQSLRAFRSLQNGRPAAAPSGARKAPTSRPLRDVAAPQRTATPKRPPTAGPKRRGPVPTPTAARSVPAEASSGRSDRRVVQVGAYLERDAAAALVRRLRSRGFDAYLSKTRPEGQQRHRVRVRAPAGGPETLAARLAAQGLSTWITSE